MPIARSAEDSSRCSEQAAQSHRKKLSLRALKGRSNLMGHVIARSEATWQSQPFFKRLLRFARNDTGTGMIATLPSVARNDMLSLTLG